MCHTEHDHLTIKSAIWTVIIYFDIHQNNLWAALTYYVNTQSPVTLAWFRKCSFALSVEILSTTSQLCEKFH